MSDPDPPRHDDSPRLPRLLVAAPPDREDADLALVLHVARLDMPSRLRTSHLYFTDCCRAAMCRLTRLFAHVFEPYTMTCGNAASVPLRSIPVVTAKVVCNSKLITGAGEHRQAVVQFSADNSPENKDWSLYTPALQLQMTLKGGVADRFEPGTAYTLTFEPNA